MAKFARDRGSRMRGLLSLAFAALLGVAAGLAQAPTEWWWLMPLALAAFFVLVRSRATPVLHTFIFGCGYFAFTLRWIVEPFLVDAQRHGWMAPFAIILMAAGGAAFWALSIWLVRRFVTQMSVAAPLSILGAEIFRSLAFTGFPWGLVGHALIPTPWVQAAAFGGPHFLTLLVLSFGWALSQTGRRPLVAGPVLIAFAGLWFLLSPPELVGPSEAPVVRVVQPNVAQEDKWDATQQPIYFARMLDLTREGDAVDFTAWPESALPLLMEDAQRAFEAISRSAGGAPVLTGLNRRAGTTYFTSAALIGRGGVSLDVYDKAHLAPFGEYIPFGEWLGAFGIQGLAASQGGGFTAGRGDHLVEIPGVGAARVLICYEGIFAEEIALDGPRPDLIVLITNDAWFGNGSGPQQHFAQARLRAVEQGLPLVRAANTGISGVIDPYGRIVTALPLGEAGYATASLPAALPPTLYSRVGEWPIIFFVFAAVLGLAGATYGRRVRH